MCPTIFTGTTADGMTVYARYRWGILSIRIDTRDTPPNGGASGKSIYEKQLDSTGLDGALYYDQLKDLTSDIIDWPDELSPKAYTSVEDICLDDQLN